MSRKLRYILEKLCPVRHCRDEKKEIVFTVAILIHVTSMKRAF